LFWGSYVKTLFEQIGFTPKLKTSAHSVDFEIPSRKGVLPLVGKNKIT